MALFTMLTFAQSENSTLKIEQLGYGNGTAFIKVTNKQNCSSNITISYTNKSRSKTINGLGSDTFQIAIAGGKKVEASSKTECGAGCYSSVSLHICTLLPIKFISFTATRTGSNQLTINFVSAEDYSIKSYNVNVSLDNGITWKTVKVLFPDGVVGDKQYSSIVNY
jgi:hypothetical protein